MGWHGPKSLSELVAAVCFALGAVITLVWLLWKGLAWWFSR